MMRCEECDNKPVGCYCGLEKVTKKNYDRAFRECKDLKYYCQNHLPEIEKSKTTFSQTNELPNEFVQIIENDLNKMTQLLAGYLERNYQEITKNRIYAHPLDFLTGWCIGTCESSYFQVYHHDYGKSPSEIQITEIRNIISRKRILIEQAIIDFLEENNES